MSLGNAYFRIKILLLLVIMPLAAQYNLSGFTAVLVGMLDALYLVNRIRDRKLKIDVSSFCLMCIFLIWNVVIFVLFDYSGIVRLVQVICLILCFFSSSCLEHRYIDLRFVRNVIAFQLGLFCVWWPVSGFVTNYYSAFYIEGNFFGGLVLNYLVLLIFIHQTIDRKKKTFYRIMYAVIAFLLILANSRSVYLTLAVFLCGCLFMKSSAPQNVRKQGVLLILGTAAVGVAFTVIYPQLLGTELGLKLEMLSRLVFKKNFFSGRQTIWNNLEELIAQSPYLGYGLTATPGVFFETKFSSHNLWLQIALQSGMIGVVILAVLYVNSVYRSYHRDNKEWYIVVSYGAAYIIHECFEVSLTQNNISHGILVWFFLGLAIAVKKNNLQKSNLPFRS